MSAALDTSELVIEGYEGLTPIGHGGLGDVYRAVRRSTGATVAIKILRPVDGVRASDHTVAWHRCRRELAALVALAGHAHVVGVIEVLDLAGGPALVMEYAPGGSVAGLVARRGAPLDIGEVALVGIHTTEALTAAHARGIVHRDVKPHNLLIDAFGQVKLCDFGVAALARSAEFRTRTSAVSLRYASPEDLEDDGPVGPPSDVYSLGATLLFLAHGVHLELRDRLTPWAPPPGSPAALAALDALIAACLHPDPHRRPAASEVLLTLDRIAAGAPQPCRALPVQAVAAPHPAAVGADVAADVDLDVDPDGGRTVARSTRHVRGPAVVAARRPPAGGRRRHRAALAGSAAAMLAVFGVVWWLLGRSGSPVPPADAAPAIGIVARPAGLVDVTALEWPAGPVGECLVQEPGRARLVPVACERPHDLERVATGDLPDGTGPEAAHAACAEASTAYAGEPPAGLGLSVSSTRPSDAGWQAGDRAFQCWLGAPGHRLTGTARQQGERRAATAGGEAPNPSGTA